MDKLAVSNIAWTGNDSDFFSLLSRLGVKGVEVAPGKIANWPDLDAAKVKSYRKLADSFGLKIPSFQAIFYGKQEFQLLGDEILFQDMIKHIEFVSEMAAVAGAKIMVFGAPKNRLLLHHRYEEVKELAAARLERLAKIAWRNDVSIGLEAVPSCYAGECITSYKESLELVKVVDHPGLVFHLDTGCTFLNDESIAEAISSATNKIKHFHISQPHLNDFSVPEKYHSEAAIALHQSHYDKWLCIEMKEANDPLKAITNAVSFVGSTYT